MDSKIIDPDSLFVNAEECQRLSYEMLFNDGAFQSDNGNGHSADEKNGDGADEFKPQQQQEKELRRLEKKWKQKLKDAKEEAYHQGLNEGKQQGKDEAMDSIKQQMVTVEEAVASVDGRIGDLMDDLKPHMATMVFDVVEKIIGLPVKSETLKENVATEVREILSSIEKEVQINVMVAATDYGFIVRALKDLPNSEHIEISSSESLNTGEYSIDTHNERIVKSFKKMLKDFREKVALEETELEVGE
jgi:flagellar biosynthesis/type III secretory pathway protein FliH